MEKDSMKILSRNVIIAILAVAALTASVYAQNDGIVLLVQQSPVQGGTVTPEMGVHKFGLGEEIVLTAIPEPGYQFVYWIGDVGDPTSNRTTTYLDSPKIIIAVFERSEFEFLVTDELAQSRSGGGLIQSPADYSNQGYSGGSGAGDRRRIGPPDVPPPPDEPTNDFPVPPNGEVNDFPVPEPIPEPTTISMLILGCLGLVRNRRRLTNKGL